MADQLDMTHLSLADSKHANGYAGQPSNVRSAYIPPHLRASAGVAQPPPGPMGPPGPPPGMDAPPAAMNGSVNEGPWGPPPQRYILPSPPSRHDALRACVGVDIVEVSC